VRFGDQFGRVDAQYAEHRATALFAARNATGVKSHSFTALQDRSGDATPSDAATIRSTPCRAPPGGHSRGELTGAAQVA